MTDASFSTDYPESALLMGAAESVWEGSDALVTIRIEARGAIRSYMEALTGTELYENFITDSDIRHIKKKHGVDEASRGQVSIEPRDFACLPCVLAEFDSCEQVDIDKLGNKKFLIQKSLGLNLYVVTIQRGKRKLEIKTMWKKRGMSGASC